MLKQTLRIAILSFVTLLSNAVLAQPTIANIDEEVKLLSTKVKNLDPKIVKLGLEAYYKAKTQGLVSKDVLTIVDYSKSAEENRLFVFDLNSHRVLFQELVAHGVNSGKDLPTSFSNHPRSLKSSLGVFVTGQPYVGQHGYSLRLNGLEKGFNDMAAARKIVMHAAYYVSHSFARMNGGVGHSWGCFALNPKTTQPIIDTIKNGTLLFAYAPNREWLKHSRFLS